MRQPQNAGVFASKFLGYIKYIVSVETDKRAGYFGQQQIIESECNSCCYLEEVESA